MANTTKGYPYPVGATNNNTPADVQALAEFVDASPGVAPLSTTARDALPAGQKWEGRQIYNTTTKQFEWWDGSVWQPFGYMRGEIKYLAYKPGTVPNGWLLANGQTVSQSTYSDLFAIFGTLHNTGGETAGTFRLPNLTRRVPVGFDATDLVNYDVGDVGGQETVTLTIPNVPSHQHSIDHDHPAVTSGDQSANHTHGVSGATSVNAAGVSESAAGNHVHASGSGGGLVAIAFATSLGLSAGAGAVADATTAFAGNHSHSLSDPGHNHSFGATTGNQSVTHNHSVDVPAFVGNGGATGGGTAHENRMPFITMYALVKY